MKAVYFDRHGGLEVLEYGDVPTPEPDPGWVRVAIEACCAVRPAPRPRRFECR